MNRLMKIYGFSCVLVGTLLAQPISNDKNVNMNNKKTIGLERLYYNSLSKKTASKKIKYTPILKEAFNLLTDEGQYVALDRFGNKKPIPNVKKVKKIPNFSLVVDKFLLSVKKEKNEASAFYALYFMKALGFGSKQQKEEIAPILAKTLAKKQNCYAYTILYSQSGLSDEKKLDELIQQCPQYETRFKMLFNAQKEEKKGNKK